jgi:hypothetical protein
MYIPPFVCGVLATIGCEILALFISVVPKGTFKYKRQKVGKI